MATFGLNDHHTCIIMNFLRLTRYQRAQNLKAVEYAFKDLEESRLLEDTYTLEEIKDLLNTLCKSVRGDVETELINSSHTYILLLKQLFTQAEKWHLRLQVDLSELQNREDLEMVKILEETDGLNLKSDKTFSHTKLAPLGEDGGVSLLQLEIDRLKLENDELRNEIKETEEKYGETFEESVNLKKRLDNAMEQVEKLKLRELDTPAEPPSKLSEVEEQLSQVKRLLASNLELSTCSQKQMELELVTTRQQVLEVRSQLQLAEQELERKFSETAAYKNMKQMLQQKNKLIRDLRTKLTEYEPEIISSEDEENETGEYKMTMS